MKTRDTLATRASKIVLAATLTLSCFGITSLTALASAHQTRDQAFALDYGWHQQNGTWYYLDGYACLTHWQYIDGAWYYFNPSGSEMQTGWQYIDREWYYFDSNGRMQTGWKSLGGKWYYFAGNGQMQNGWQKINGKWYCFDTDGAMKTGWHDSGSISCYWYYLDKSGAMVTGWNKVGSKWYYHNQSGLMHIGWRKIGGKWYHFNGDGVMSANKWVGNYYCKSDGSMATNQWIGQYHVGANGLWDGASDESKSLHVSTAWYEFDLPAYWKDKVAYKIEGAKTTVYMTSDAKWELFTINATKNYQRLPGQMQNLNIYENQTGAGVWVQLGLGSVVTFASDAIRNNSPLTPQEERMYAQAVDLQTGGSVTLDQIKQDPQGLWASRAPFNYIRNQVLSTIFLKDAKPIY